MRLIWASAVVVLAVSSGARVAAAHPAISSAAMAQDVPPDAPEGSGPRGTSGEVREDVVGYATRMAVPADARFGAVAIGVAHPSLPLGGFVEVTALDTGRTIVAMVVARSGSAAVLALSPGAAKGLGVGERAAVRVRTTIVGQQDQVALRSGQMASPRLDAPPALLTALRRMLPVQQSRERQPAAGRLPSMPTTRSMPSVSAPVGGGFLLQVAALSSAERAGTLARQLGGHVTAMGKLYRVQLGPFADLSSAQRARDGVARKGYADARISHTESE